MGVSGAALRANHITAARSALDRELAQDPVLDEVARRGRRRRRNSRPLGCYAKRVPRWPSRVARAQHCTADWLAIEVSDTGPGIPISKRELIFQELTRLDSEAQHGAGVGLAISRRIARLLGGDITVESRADGPAGHGSTFTLWLPEQSAPSSPTDR